MGQIMLFGSHSICGIPTEVMAWIQQYTNQGHKFLIGDGKGVESALHRALSSVGATVTIYAMDDARNNTYEFPVKSFNTFYDEEAKTVTISASDNSIEPFTIENVEKAMDIPHNRQWYEFRDRQMIKDCDIAIGLWDGETKATSHIIQLLNIYNKPCYVFTIK